MEPVYKNRLSQTRNLFNSVAIFLTSLKGSTTTRKQNRIAFSAFQGTDGLYTIRLSKNIVYRRFIQGMRVVNMPIFLKPRFKTAQAVLP